MVDMFKTEAAFGSIAVGSVGEQIPAESVASKEAEPVSEDTSVPEPQSVVTESTVQQEQENAEAKEEAPVVEEQSPLTPKKATTRSKKTVQ